MDKDVPIAVFDESEGTPDIRDNHHMDLMELKLDIFGKPLHVCIGAENKPAKLSDLVPSARFLSAEIISLIKQHIINNGDTIACRANCSACCRYLIPLSIPEVIRLTEEVTVMAEWERRFVNESSLFTARCILELTPKYSFEKFTNTGLETGFRPKEVSDWYSRMNLPCPFLLNNLCTIYEQRPIACCEHLVIGSASNCRNNSTNHAQPVQMPISILTALAQLTSEIEQTTIEAIALPFAFVWCQENPEYSKHTWPASQLVRRFINILITQNRYNNKAELQKTDNSCRD
ncbi:MAG: YkgJ family cysteine cluster protein [Planctomycetota bacterium]